MVYRPIMRSFEMDKNRLVSRQIVFSTSVALLVLARMAGQALAASTASPEEMAAAHLWIAAKVETPPKTPRAKPGLLVLANHDSVLRNTRGGRPMTKCPAIRQPCPFH
jgi:hypothetical protein